MTEQLASEFVPERDRRLVPAAIALLALVCWIATARMALQPAHAHHHQGMGALSLGALFLMWAVMMAAMMIPPELPLFTAWARAHTQAKTSAFRAALFLAGFLGVWTAFSLAAAALHSALQNAEMIDSKMALQSRPLGGALLILAGLVQLSPLKRACLIRCRAAIPTSAIAGLRSGLISIASCGALMLIVFVTGVMSLPAMIALTALLVVERIVPKPFVISATAGAVLVLWGLWQIAAP